MESALALLQLSAKGSLGGVFYFLGERNMSALTPGAATTVLQGEIFLRSYGTFSHPNVLAGFLLISLVFVFFKRSVFSFRFGMLLWLSILLIGTLGMLTTLSRVPLALWSLFLIVEAFRFALRIGKQNIPLPHRRFIWGGVVSLLLAVLISLPLSTRFVTRVLTTRFTEEAFVVREDLNRVAMQLLWQHPVTGVGLGNFLVESIRYKDAATPLYLAVQPVHNIFLLIGAETGMLGLLLFGWLLLFAWYHARSDGRVLLLLILLIGLFDHYWLTLQEGQLLFAVIIGYCYSSSPRIQSS